MGRCKCVADEEKENIKSSSSLYHVRMAQGLDVFYVFLRDNLPKKKNCLRLFFFVSVCVYVLSFSLAVNQNTILKENIQFFLGRRHHICVVVIKPDFDCDLNVNNWLLL